jgi:peptidoglycan/LPS O-acetylase OafA/YrhL
LKQFSSIFSEQQRNRVFGLDLLRSIAILLVLFSHGFDPFLAEYFPNLRLLIFMDGVDLFFVLSGFLIGTILLKQFNRYPNYQPKIIISFWKRRWMRTLPNYYFILLLILFIPVILPFIKGKSSLIPFEIWGAFLIFSQNLFSPQVNFFSEAWSLAVEEWFYLITPITLYLFYIVFRNVYSKKIIFLMMMLSIIIGITFYRYKLGLSLNGRILEWDTNIRRVVFARFDSIMYGVLGAYLKYYFLSFWRNKTLFLLFNLCGIFLIFITHYLYLDAIDNNTNLFMNTFYFSFSGIGVLLVLPQVDFLIKPPNIGIYRVLGKCVTHISLISYSIYLTHGHLILGHLLRYRNEYFDKFLPHKPIIGIIYFTVYLFISILISTFLYYTIEKTFMNLRGKEL